MGNGAVHPMAAQTIATVRRLLTHPCATEVIFSDAEPSGREWAMKAETALEVPDFSDTVQGFFPFVIFGEACSGVSAFIYNKICWLELEEISRAKWD